MGDDHKLEKLSFTDLMKNKFLMSMAGFVIISIVALRFIDYSFFNVTGENFKNEQDAIPTFLSLFEANDRYLRISLYNLRHRPYHAGLRRCA